MVPADYHYADRRYPVCFVAIQGRKIAGVG